MWNGFWKLTAMVGVIGVGLFAVYHAQKGMNFGTQSATSDSGTSDEKSTDGENKLLTDNSFPNEGSNESGSEADSKSEADVIEFVSAVEKTTKGGNQRQRQKLDETQEDLTIAAASDPAPPSRTVTSKQNLAKSSPVKQKARISFDEQMDLPDESSGAAAEETKPERLRASRAQASKKVRQVNEVEEVSTSTSDTSVAVVEEETVEQEAPAATEEPSTEEPSAEPTNDAFPAEEDGTAPATGDASPAEIPESLTRDPAAVESEPEPDPAPPPRSRRAMKKLEKADLEEQTETIQLDVQSSKAGITAEIEVSEPEPVQSSDPPPAERKPAEFLLEQPQSVPPSDLRSAPRDLLPETRLESTDPPPADRPTSKRARSASPAQMPMDLDGELSSNPPKRNREPMAKRSAAELTANEMIGDGVAGDPSQRGLQQPRLTIEKVAQQQAVLGQPLVYTIIVKNVGSVDAKNIVIEDRIPKGTKLEGTSPQAELSGKRLIWNQPLLKPKEEKKISIKVTPTQEGPIGSVARVYFATEVTAEIVVAAPQLSFTVNAPSEMRRGQRYDLVFTLKNTGKVDATNIIVHDLLPEELKSEYGNDIECPIGKLAPDEVREIVLSVTAEKTGTVVNNAVATADAGVKKSLDSTIDIVGEVLTLIRSGQNNRLYVERPVTFSNTIRNDGNQRAEKVRIAELVPAGMEFAAASDGGKYDPSLKAVVWTIGPLAPGNDKTVQVKYVPRETGTFEAKVTATGSLGSSASVNASVDVEGKPELQMETASATGAVTVGDRITSRFQLNNSGTAAAKNVQLRIRLPRELRLISVKGAKFEQADDFVTFESIPEFAPRTKVAYELVLEPTAEADAQIGLEITADHLAKPGRRLESIQIENERPK